MGYAIYHTEKGKSPGGGLGHHIDRTPGKEHTYPHADPSKLELNERFSLKNGYTDLPLPEAVKQRIKDGYKGKRKLRSDSVKYLNHVLTGSHEDMKKIFSTMEGQKAWVNANYKFIKDEFGAENIVRFNLHLDEKTPHLHCITVPLTNEGRLSAKEILGNKRDMQDRQDRYAEAMKEFGLERGIKGTGIKHEDAKDYYKRINQALETVAKGDLTESKSINLFNTKKTAEELQKSLKSANMALIDLQKKNESAKYMAKYTRLSKEKTEKELSKARHDLYLEKKKGEDKLKKLNNRFVKIVMNPEETEKARKQIQEQMDRKKNRSRGM